MKKPKIVIFVDGGVVQSVHADTELHVVLVDNDNLTDGEGFTSDQAEQIYDTATEGLKDQDLNDPDKSLALECNGEKCGAKVYPEDPYYSSPCGTFCSDCMHDHAEECEVCANEFELEGSEA